MSYWKNLKKIFKYCLPRKLSNQSIKWRRKRMNLFDGGIEIVTPKKHTQISTGTSQYEEHFNCIQHFAFVFLSFLWVRFLFGFFPGKIFFRKKIPEIYIFFSFTVSLSALRMIMILLMMNKRQNWFWKFFRLISVDDANTKHMYNSQTHRENKKNSQIQWWCVKHPLIFS